MKGRRGARRAALQALYEIDVAGHAPGRVLAARVPELYRSAVAGMVSREHAGRVAALVDGLDLVGRRWPAPAQVATTLDVESATAQAVVKALPKLAAQADYMAALVGGVLANVERLDAVIAGIAPEWPVDQMAPVDRNILRLALWEIAAQSSPLKVAISEAVELARLFSGEGARRLVNGALGTFAQDPSVLRLDSPPPAGLQSTAELASDKEPE